MRTVRGRGLMVGFDVDGRRRARHRPPRAARAAARLQRDRPETIRFLPPLIVGEAEIDDAVDRIAPLLAEAAGS